LSDLPRNLLTQGTALRSLMRMLGGSVGISILEAMLAQNTQIVHSQLMENLRPDNPLVQNHLLPHLYSLTEPSGVAALNAEVTRQAAMIGYIDDFKLMMLVIVLALPLVLLIRVTPRAPAVAPAPSPAAATGDD
jgi:DHA2 family multidrug resistance protein